MDAIKKKMVAMKMEKENALDRAEQLEQKLRETEEAKAKVKTWFCILNRFYKETRAVRIGLLLYVILVFYLRPWLDNNQQWTTFHDHVFTWKILNLTRSQMECPFCITYLKTDNADSLCLLWISYVLKMELYRHLAFYFDDKKEENYCHFRGILATMFFGAAILKLETDMM